MSALPPSPDWGKRELVRAAQEDDPSAVKRVADFGYSLDSVLLDSDSALHIAAAHGCKNACAALINNRAAVNLREQKNGFTPLHYAAGEGHPEVVRLLLSHGGDAGAEDFHGSTPGAWAKTSSQGPAGQHSEARSPEPSRSRNHEFPELSQRQEAALRRLERRRVELLETEDEVSRNLQRLALVLKAMSTLAPWSSSEAYSGPLQDTRQALLGVYKAHVHVRWLAAESLAALHSLANLFPAPIVTQLVLWHSQYEASAGLVSALLRLRPAPPLPAGISAEQVAELLVRPTQRLMRYQLFLEEMAEDAALLPQGEGRGLGAGLEGALRAAREMVQAVNEGKREREQRERFERIVTHVSNVPEGVALRRRNRQLLLEQDDIMQRDKQGYRKLVVFNDAVLVLKHGMQRSGPTQTPISAQLRFKDLISLRGFTTASCPTVIPPDADSAQGPAMRERSFAFELLGRTFLGPEGAIARVVDAIRSASAVSVPRPASLLQALSSSGRQLLDGGHAQVVGRDADGKPLVLYAF